VIAAIVVTVYVAGAVGASVYLEREAWRHVARALLAGLLWPMVALGYVLQRLGVGGRR
jgi:hypothetical protein